MPDPVSIYSLLRLILAHTKWTLETYTFLGTLNSFLTVTLSENYKTSAPTTSLPIADILLHSSGLFSQAQYGKPVPTSKILCFMLVSWYNDFSFFFLKTCFFSFCDFFFLSKISVISSWWSLPENLFTSLRPVLFYSILPSPSQ